MVCNLLVINHFADVVIKNKNGVINKLFFFKETFKNLNATEFLSFEKLKSHFRMLKN